MKIKSRMTCYLVYPWVPQRGGGRERFQSSSVRPCAFAQFQSLYVQYPSSMFSIRPYVCQSPSVRPAVSVPDHPAVSLQRPASFLVRSSSFLRSSNVRLLFFFFSYVHCRFCLFVCSADLMQLVKLSK